MDFDFTKIAVICIISVFIFASVTIYSENMPSGSDIIITVDGSASWNGAWNSTVQSVIQNYSGLAWKSLWNITVQSIINSNNLTAWSPSWNTTVTEIIANYLSTLDIFAYPESEASYLVWYDSSDSLYKAKNQSTGQVDFQSTNASEVWENIRANETRIYFKGDFLLDSPFVIDAMSEITLIVDGNITLADNSDCDVIQVLNSEYITISSFGESIIDGNGANQALGDCIVINNTAHCSLYGFNIRNSKENGLLCYQSGLLNLHDLKINTYSTYLGSVLYGFYCQGVSDSFISDVYAAYGCWIVGGSSNNIVNLYFGGASTTHQFTFGSSNCRLSNIIVDSSVEHGVWIASAAHGSTINGLSVTRPQASGKVAIDVNGGNNVTITNFYIGQKYEEDDTAYGWDYGVLESGGADNNIYSNGFIYNSTISVSGLGSNSNFDIGSILINGNLCQNFVTSTNTTATTFVFDPNLAGIANYVFCSFNTTKVTGYSWTAILNQVTVTIEGSDLPENIACYADVRYVP